MAVGIYRIPRRRLLVCSQWIKSIPMVEQHDIDNPMSCVKKVLAK